MKHAFFPNHLGTIPRSFFFVAASGQNHLLPGMAVKKRPAASQASNVPVRKRPAASVVVNLDTWAAELDVGQEPDPGEYTSIVYLVTLARLLASTLAEAPHLRDPSGLSREEVRAAIWDALENHELTSR